MKSKSGIPRVRDCEQKPLSLAGKKGKLGCLIKSKNIIHDIFIPFFSCRFVFFSAGPHQPVLRNKVLYFYVFLVSCSII